MSLLHSFPDFCPVSLADKEPLEEAFRAAQPEVSELTYTNLFMFRHVHDYEIAQLNGNIIIKAKSYAGQPYFMPPVGDNKVPETVDALFDYMAQAGNEPVIEIASKDFIYRFIADSDKYAYDMDPDNSDYVYHTHDLVHLTGRKFHDKKNLLNRFVKNYPHEYRHLTIDLIPQAKVLVERWCQEKCSLEIPSTFGETEATILALDHMDRLSIKGGAVLINGVVEAIAFGEELNRDTVVVHVEKANSEYAGLYQFISSQFLANEFHGHTFVNREQDLGEPNLRKSKLSYNPVRMVEKYRITPRKA